MSENVQYSRSDKKSCRNKIDTGNCISLFLYIVNIFENCTIFKIKTKQTIKKISLFCII